MRNGSRRSRREWLSEFAFDWLETRSLPTSPMLLAGSVGLVGPGLPSATPAIGTSGSAVPTAHERARESFVAKFKGSFMTGPGRFTDQKSQTFVEGGGISN